MTPSLVSLLAFVAWALLLSLAVVTWRGPLIMSGRYGIHTIPSGTPHGPDRYWRLNRAHLNALETLAPFAAIVLLAKVSGRPLSWVEILAPIVPVARVIQSVVHVAANTPLSVTLRFLAFFTQWLAMAAMVVAIAWA